MTTVAMGYLKNACEVVQTDRWSRERRQSGVEVDVTGSIKRNMLRWFRHM